MDKLFVYGIFLSQSNRDRFGMVNPQYATVAGYLTRGRHIVEAVAVLDRPDICLTGLVVDIPESSWERLDQLEAGYDRRIITTVSGIQAYMYVGKDRDERGNNDHQTDGKEQKSSDTKSRNQA